MQLQADGSGLWPGRIAGVFRHLLSIHKHRDQRIARADFQLIPVVLVLNAFPGGLEEIDAAGGILFVIVSGDDLVMSDN